MANLRNIKDRINSVKNTQKITKAMKMVAAAKVKKAEAAVKASRPFTLELYKMFCWAYQETLKNKCCLCARVLVSELLNNMKTEIIIPINQNEKDATYFPQIGVEDILIDFEKSAREIDCKIRGLQPWQSSYIPHKNVFFRVKNVQIRENNTKYTSAGTIVEKSEKTFSVISGDNKILTFNNVRLYGGIRPFLTDFYLKFFVKIGDLAI